MPAHFKDSFQRIYFSLECARVSVSFAYFLQCELNGMSEGANEARDSEYKHVAWYCVYKREPHTFSPVAANLAGWTLPYAPSPKTISHSMLYFSSREMWPRNESVRLSFDFRVETSHCAAPLCPTTAEAESANATPAASSIH